MARADDLLVSAVNRESGPAFGLRLLLDASWYALRFTFYERDLRWRLSLLDVAGAVQVDGLRVVEGRDLVAPFHYLTVPPGQLYVEDVEGLGRPPDRLGWQRYARLYYRPLAVVALAAGTADEVS